MNRDLPVAQRRRRGARETVDLQALHELIVAGSAPVRDALADAVLPRLRAGLRGEWPHAAPAMIDEAAEDAILWYLLHPGRYDPRRSALQTFLYLVARRNLIHAYRRERRRLTREVPSGLSLSGPLAERQSAITKDPGPSFPDPSALLSLASTETERQFVLARAAGAAASTLAAILGAGTDLDEQRRAIHRVMARLRQRAQRQRPASSSH